MKRRILLIAGLMLASAAAHAQMGGGMGEPEFVIPEVDKESLILQRPDKWYPYFKESEQRIDTYYFPTGQKPEKWKEALQSQQFLSTMGLSVASQVYQMKIQANEANCASYEVVEIPGTEENGYSKVEWIENCTSTDDSKVVTLNKTVLGNDQLYVVSKIWKYEPGEREIEEWKRFMSNVFVCDPTTGSNPCRPPNSGRGERDGPR